MLETIRRPRWLALLVVALVLGGLFVAAGIWQYNVAQQDARQEALEEAQRRPVVPLTTVVEPHTAFPDEASNQRVEATGRYDADDQVLVVDRRLRGEAGYWVLTPLTVAETGAHLAVVRGFVRSVDDARPPLVTGDVTVVGSLAPGESPREPLQPLGPGQLASVDLARLVNAWDGDIYNAFVFAISETPDATGAGGTGATAVGAVQRVPPPEVPTGLTWRNAAYALQWWVFAAFALWMWGKMVRDEHRRTTRAGTAAPIEPARPSAASQSGAPS